MGVRDIAKSVLIGLLPTHDATGNAVCWSSLLSSARPPTNRAESIRIRIVGAMTKSVPLADRGAERSGAKRCAACGTLYVGRLSTCTNCRNAEVGLRVRSQPKEK